MTCEPLISLILPIYNVSEYIEKCARSVFSQTYRNIEFIFVDDGSPDDSVDILNRLIDREFSSIKDRIILVRQQNMGLPMARSEGRKRAHGDYILHIDSDDWCRKDMVEKMVKAAVTTDADMVVCNYFNVYNHLVVPRREKQYPDRISTMRALFNHHSFRGFLWNKMARRSLFTEHDILIPEYSMCEDMILTAQLVTVAKKITFVRSHLYFYRKTNIHSVSRKRESLRLRELVINKMNLYRYYQGRPASPIAGIEESFMLKLTQQIFLSKEFSLFKSYPCILETTRALSLPGAGYDMPFKEQRWVLRRLHDYDNKG